MALKGYSTFPKVPELNPLYQMQFSAICWSSWGGVGPKLSAEKQSAYSMAPGDKVTGLMMIVISALKKQTTGSRYGKKISYRTCLREKLLLHNFHS